MKTQLLSAAVMMAFLAAPAVADDSLLDRQSEMVQMLLKYDSNNDGIVSRDEIIAGKTAEFAEADSDADGYLSWSEFNTLMTNKQTSRITSIFSVMDADTSGDVTVDEFASAFADKSSTQTATVFTLAAGADALMSEEELAALFGDNTGKQMWAFARMDTDGDRQLTVTEYTEMPTAPTRSDSSKKTGERRR